jgi:hypothetical protein
VGWPSSDIDGYLWERAHGGGEAGIDRHLMSRYQTMRTQLTFTEDGRPLQSLSAKGQWPARTVSTISHAVTTRTTGTKNNQNAATYLPTAPMASRASDMVDISRR